MFDEPTVDLVDNDGDDLVRLRANDAISDERVELHIAVDDVAEVGFRLIEVGKR